MIINYKCAVKPLILMVLLSIGFFYLELGKPYLVNTEKLEEVILLLGIVGGLYLIAGERRYHGKSIPRHSGDS